MLNLAEQRYGRLVATKRHGKTTYGQTQWECKCDCGNSVLVGIGNLRSGHTRSCGCLSKDASSDIGKRNAKHGESFTRIYRIHSSMIERCFSQKSKDYQKYGGRGITVCDEWKNSYEAFRDWSFANGYADNLSIDRVDNNGPYAPWNCRWTTAKVQQNNTRRNRVIEYDGKTLTLAQWSDETGLNYFTLWSRLQKGWSVEKALTTKIKQRSNRYA